MNPNDIPTEITRLVYDDPVHRGQRAISQNDIARMLAHYWPAIEKHVREQVAQEIEASPVVVNGGTYPMQSARAAEQALSAAARTARREQQ